MTVIVSLTMSLIRSAFANPRWLTGELIVPTVQDTAYPRLKTNLSQKELDSIYKPTADKLSLAKRITRGRVANLGFLILLKVFQRGSVLHLLILQSNLKPELVTIDIQPNHYIVHLLRLREADCLSGQSLDPCS